MRTDLATSFCVSLLVCLLSSTLSASVSLAAQPPLPGPGHAGPFDARAFKQGLVPLAPDSPDEQGPEGWSGFRTLSPTVQGNVLKTFSSTATPIGPPNVRANDITGDLYFESQSDVTIAAWNQYVVVTWFDSKGYDGGSWIEYAYSCDFGATFTDGGGPPIVNSDDVRYRGTVIADTEGNFYLAINYGVHAWAQDTHVVYRGRFTGCSFSWDPPVTAATNGGDPNEFFLVPRVAASPVDSSLALTYDRHTTVNGFEEVRIEAVVSHDRGATWDPPQVLSTWFRHHDPNIAVGPNGELYVVWFNDFYGYYQCDLSSPNWYENVLMNKSVDGGATWSGQTLVTTKVNNVRLNTGPGDWYGWSSYGPSVAVDRSGGPGNGNIYLCWQEAGAWPAPVETGNFVTEVEPNDVPSDALTISPGDSAVAQSDVSQSDYWRLSLTAGQSIIVRLEPDDYTCANNSTANNFWMRLYSDPFDPTTGTPDTLLAVGNTNTWIQQIVFSAPKSGDYYLRVYQSAGVPIGYTLRTALITIGPDANTPARDEGDIVAIASADGGATWSSKIVVNSDVPAGYRETIPAVTVDGEGRVRFFWFDRRESATTSHNTAQLTDIYMGTSTDYLATVGPGQRITDESTTNSAGPRTAFVPGGWMGAASDGGHVVAAWADQRGSNVGISHYDAYTSFLDFEPPVTTFETAPAESGYVASSSVPLEWAGNDRKSPSTSLEYSTDLDGGGFGPYSPDTTTVLALSEGWHTFSVRARDEAGNEEATAVRTFAVDLTNPSAMFTGGPGEGMTVLNPDVTMSWSGSDNLTSTPDLEFAYQLDGGGFTAWGPATTTDLTGLTVGAHSFDVQVRDLAGNTVQITRNFNVDNAVRWIADANGNWQDGANWNTGAAPTSADSVVIDRPSADVTVTVPTSGQASGPLYCTETLQITNGVLSISGASEVEHLVLNGTGTLGGGGDILVISGMTWYGGTVSGSGIITLDTGSANSLTDAGINRTLSGRTLRNLGTLGWSGRDISLQYGAVLDNQGLIQSYGSSSRSLTTVNGSASFVNDGTLQITGSHILNLAASINLDLNISGSGLFDIDAGTLRFQEPATIDGSFDVAAGATLEFYADTQTLTASSSIVSQGTVAKSSSGSVSAAGNVDIASLSVGGGSFSIAHDDTIPSVTMTGGTFSVAGDLLVTSGLAFNGGTMAGTGTTTLDTGTTNSMIDIGVNRVLSGRTLTNLGTLGWSGRDISLQYGAVLDNQGFFQSYGSGSRSITVVNGFGNPSSFINDGTFQKTGTHTLSLTAGVNLDLETSGSGLFDIDAGTLQFAEPATIDGSFDVAPGATLDFFAGTQTLTASSSLVSQGSVTKTSSGSASTAGSLDVTLLSVTGGSFTVAHDDTIPSLAVNGGTFAVSGDLLVTSDLTWNAGTMSGAGTTTLDTLTTNSFPAGGSARILTSGRTLRNLGSIGWSAGALTLDNGATLDNQGFLQSYGTGSRNITTASGGNTSGYVINDGTFQKSGSHILTFTAGTNRTLETSGSGLFDIDAGTFQFQQPATIDGTFDVAPGAILDFNASNQTLTASSSLVSQGSVTRSGLSDTYSVAVSGNLDIASLIVDRGTFSIAHGDTIPSITVNGGTLAVAGDLLVTTGMTWSGGTMSGGGATTLETGSSNSLPNGGVSRILTSGRTLRNLGGLAWSGGNLLLNNNAVFDNQWGMSVYGSGTRTLSSSNSGTLLNSGTLEKANTNIFNIAAAISVTNTGTFDVNAGIMQINGPFSNFASNTLTGGVYEITSTLQFQNANIVNNAATIVLDGASSQIQNQSSTNALANFAANDASGVFTLLNGKSLSTGGLGNAGAMTIGDGSTLNVTGAYTQTAGTTTLVDVAALNATGGVDIQAGSLGGTGSVGADIQNAGTVSPGASPGTLVETGNYAQTGGGHLGLEIGGATPADVDLLQITGQAAFAGSLDVSLVNGYSPALGDTFTVATYDSSTGAFDALNLPGLAGNLNWGLTQGPTQLRLVVAVNDTTPPVVSFTGGPAEDQVLVTGDVTLEWTATDDNTPRSGLEFAYELDGGGYSAWGADSTASYTGLSVGPHSFDVQARDQQGNVGTATRNFEIDVAVRWAVDASGDWGTGSNWNTGSVPTAADSVVIDRAAGTYTVTVSTAAEAAAVTSEENLTLASGGTLTVPGPVLVNNTFALAGGTLVGATVLDGASTSATYSSGTLEGVTLNTSLNRSADYATLGVQGGLILNDVLTMDVATVVTFSGSQSLTGTGEVVFGGNLIISRIQMSADDTLNIGAGITLHGSYGEIGAANQYVVNQGTIRGEGGAALLVGGLVETSGLLEANGGVLTVDGTWTNTGTLRAQNGGTLNLGGSTTTAGLGTFEGVTGTVQFTGVLDNGGDTLALSAATGSPVLNYGGVIQGGAVSSGDATPLRYADGVLDNVSLDTGLTRSVDFATLGVQNGLALNDLLQMGGNSVVTFTGSQALTGTGEVFFLSDVYTNTRLQASAGDTLTIGAGITIHGYRGFVSYPSNGSLVNHGTIRGDQPGAFGLTVADLAENTGLLEADGGTVTVLAGTWTNSGTLRAQNGGALTLGGSTTTAGLGTFEGVTGTIQLACALDNAGDDLMLSATTGSPVLASGGTILGGTVSSGDATALRYANGILNGMTMDADMQESGSNAMLTVLGGLVLNGTLRMDLNATLAFTGSQALGGTGDVYFASDVYYLDQLQPSSGDTLTIEPGMTIHGYRGIVGAASASLVNQGTIRGDQPGAGGIEVRGLMETSGLLEADGGVVTVESGTWTNTGTLRAQNGGILNLGGATTTAGLGAFEGVTGTVQFTGLLDNTGHNLALSASTGSPVLASGGMIQGGTVSSGDATPLGYASGALDGVTVDTDLLESANNAMLTVTSGLVLNGTLRMDKNGTLALTGSQTLGGTGDVYFASDAYFLDQLQPSAGDTLTVGAGMTIHGYRGIVGTASASVVNQGAIRADQPGAGGIEVRGLVETAGLLEADGGTVNVTSGSPVNTGTVQSQGGGFLTVGVPFVTSGLVHIASTSQITFNDAFTQTAGTTTVDSTATLNGGVLTFSGGVLEGYGTILATVVNEATVSPGASAGRLEIGDDYQQAADGHLLLELGGSTPADYDQLLIGNQATLAGTLSVSTINAFSPAADDSFTVLEYASHTGAFDHLALPPLSGGMSWDVLDGATSWTLVAVATDTIPPSTFLVSNPPDGGWVDTSSVTLVWSGTDNRTPTDSLLYSYQVDADPPSALAPDTSVTVVLAPGPHTFQVFAQDLAGNQDDSPATVNFTVDVTDPETQILAGPAEGSTADTSAVYFSWIGTDDQAPQDSLVYARRLDGGAFTAFAPDTSATLTSLTEGFHTVEVKARDLAGNEDQTPDARSFAVDLTPPVVTITTAPDPFTTNTTADFAWMATDAITPPESLEYAYRLDGAALSSWGPDTSATYPGLAEGAHTFEVQARDAVGRIGTGTADFFVDLTEPNTVQTLGPPDGGYADSTVSFGYSGTDNGSATPDLVYSYQLDGGGYTPFASATSTVLTGLATGPHTFEVRARDQAGNIDSTPLVVNFEVDILDPETAITFGPAEGDTLTVNYAAFTWTGTDDTSPLDSLRYARRLDAAAFGSFLPDTSTVLTVLSDGAHTFQVKARDLAGNEDATPAARGFVVDANPPVVTFTAGPANNASLDTTGVAFAWVGSDAVTPGHLLEYAYRLDLDPQTPWGPDTTASFASLSEGVHTLEAFARDLAGHEGSAVRSFRIDTTPPVANAPTAKTLDEGLVEFTLTAFDVGTVQSFNVQVGEDISFASPDLDTTFVSNSPATLLFQGSYGHTYYARARATDVAGNQGLFSTYSNGAVIGNQADLLVLQVQAPPSATSGQQIQVSWTVADSGLGGTNVPAWYDRIYLSLTPTLDLGTAIVLGTPQNLTYLQPGDSYTNQGIYTLPQGIAGTYYAIVYTDVLNNLSESGGSNNTGVSAAVAIALGDLPDLQATSISVPSNAFSGDPVAVSWSVKNFGTGRTDVDSWYDTIFLSPDPSLDYTLPSAGQIKFLDQPLAHILHVGALEADSAYSATAPVTLPPLAQGQYRVFVWSDINAASAGQQLPEKGSVFENVNELNNGGGVSDSISIVLTPPADLVVESVDAPAGASSGSTVSVSWTVRNSGLHDTFENFWNDRLYVSTDSTFDGGDLVLATVGHSGVLALDSTYTASRNVTLDPSWSGSRWFFVATDIGGNAVELYDTNNLSAPRRIDIALAPWPDLWVPSVLAPDTAQAATGTAISWTVRNKGTGNLPATSWKERLYLSTNPVLNTATATLLAQLTVSAATPVQRTAKVNLGSSLGGTYYVHAVTDADNQVFENTDEGNNVSAPATMVVLPHPPVDLVLNSLTAPDSMYSGGTFPIEWTVTNSGAGFTLKSSWNERVYLSTDDVLSTGTDTQILSLTHSGVLNAGQSYLRQTQITIPNNLSGFFYVIAVTDPTGTTGDVNLANNWEASGGSQTGQPAPVEPPPSPDLAVTGLSTNAANTAGQPVRVYWTIENSGGGVPQTPDWVVSVYLSQDPLLGFGDRFLGSTPGGGVLSSLASYDDSLDVVLPSYASGPYYLVLKADAQDVVYEAGAESNNTASVPVVAQFAAVADLQVTGVSGPANATPGEPVTVSWTLQNTGGNPATGVVNEAIYVSADDQFVSTEDPVVGLLQRTIDIPPGGSLQVQKQVLLSQAFLADLAGNITKSLPGVTPGSYYFLVRTNIKAGIHESNLDNDLGVSPGVTTVDVPELVIGSPANVPMADDQTVYYRITPGAGLDMTVGVTSDESDATNEVYVAYGRVPNLDDFDFSGPPEFTSAPSILVPSTQAGDYYVLVRTLALPLGVTTQNATVSATSLPFSISSITPDAGGEGGEVTCTLRGAGFRDTTQVFLRYSVKLQVPAARTELINTTEMRVRWDLSTVPIATYDVLAKNGQEMVYLPNGFHVEPPLNLQVEATTVQQDVIRDNSTAYVTFKYRNVSNVNAPNFQARVVLPATAELVSVATSPRLLRTSDIFDGVTPVSGDWFQATDPTTGSDIKMVDLLAADIAPDEELQVTLGLRNFPGTPFSIRSLQEVMDTPTFLGRAAEAIDAARNAILLDASNQTAATLALASDAGAFLDSALVHTYVEPGLITPEDLIAYPLASGTAYKELQGASNWLSELRFRTLADPDPDSCAILETTPACSPDLDPLQSILPDCAVCFDAPAPVRLRLPQEVLAQVPTALCDGFSETVTANARVVSPCDPNHMTSPAGYGEEKWISAVSPVPYTIDFENLSETSTAPAQVVTITGVLDDDLNMSSFRLGNLGFGDNVINVPSNTSSFTTEQYYADIGLRVRVVAGIDISTRTAFWTFTSIDPATGEVPTNPFIGFLPVNDPFGSGQGFVTYTVSPTSGAATGTTLDAQGEITFDTNPPLVTNVSSNTLDAALPSSSINSSTQVDSTTFVLGWSGTDPTGGSGLEGFDLYVRQDQGPFLLLQGDLSDTTFQFIGDEGHVYGFHTLARDNSGNREAAKTNAEVEFQVRNQTGIGEGASSLKLRLLQNSPNPFNRATTIAFVLPKEDKVLLRVFDVAGRLVRTPVDQERLPAGPHAVTLSGDGLSSGIYFYRLTVGDKTMTRKLVVMR